MLEELRKYSSLGTAGYYWEVLSLFYDHPDTDWDEHAINAHFKGRIIDDTDIYDGGLHLLVLSEILELDVNGYYLISYKFSHRLHSKNHCKGRVLEAILKALKEDETTYTIFAPEFCTFDFVNNVIQIEKSAFGLKFGNIRNVLISLDFLIPHPNYPDHTFAINKSHRKLFDWYLTDGIRKRQITPDQLKNLQAQQLENGLAGEKFVLNYEIKRTGREDDVEWIANYDSAAGFDIMSFETNASARHDRYIEVKAYSGKIPYFYWSRNEMKEANSKRTQYYLYLVNISEIKYPEYEPTIIRNPIVDILENDEWDKTVDKYHVVRTFL